MRKYFICFGFCALFFSLNSFAQPAAARPAAPATAATTPFLPAKIAGTITLKTPAGAAGQANGLKCANIIVSVDTTIRKNPQFAYLSIEFNDITGNNQMDILNGTHLFWVYDKGGKEVKIPGIVLSSCKAGMENGTPVFLTVKVPYRLKTDKNLYTIHYRWESKDKTRNIDMLTTK